MAVPYGLPPNFTPLFVDNTGTGNSALYVGWGAYQTGQTQPAIAIQYLTPDANGNATTPGLWGGTYNTGLPNCNLVWANRASYSYS